MALVCIVDEKAKRGVGALEAGRVGGWERRADRNSLSSELLSFFFPTSTSSCWFSLARSPLFFSRFPSPRGG